MFKPVHFVAAARFTLVAGSLAVVVLTLGPFQGAEGHFGLTDKEAHAIAFGGLLAVSFLAFPRMRRNDLAIAALVLGAAVEVAQIIAHRDGNIADWLADAAGILTIYGASMIETVRKLAREQGDLTFAQIAALDRRRGRRQRATAFSPTQTDAPSFAERAARRFPVR
ncbi:antibiotic resistance protein VanZ [Caulobacter sp. FWC2]|uniref:antibiotic resistance protein VanZ n=1 Tax=Caulobacter sp. FWC2 TaxID=69664 RepID=UPI000C1495F3|nr:antibiotic resistance protein VanZ [Caulobacter sp. FWC2]PIB91498.1 antibiotic resistance protein VanZ [Caulobacter sp. FWC2]